MICLLLLKDYIHDTISLKYQRCIKPVIFKTLVDEATSENIPLKRLVVMQTNGRIFLVPLLAKLLHHRQTSSDKICY